MPVAKKYFADFVEGEFYHVFNRTNNKELMFRNDFNSTFFLEKLHVYLDPYVDVYCWCLLPNHFHFLIKVKAAESIRLKLESLGKLITSTETKYLKGSIELSELMERAFTRFFQSYAISFNKMFERKGNFFYKGFKRIRVEGPLQLMTLVLYIHTNPLRHFVEKNFNEYLWSSWNTIIEGDPDIPINKELFALFGGKPEFIESHFQVAKYKSIILEVHK